jgi:nitroimidazol reductase NimA-like FMN-containing flavoprotein (pyridoxamine 5'-phosphate oxidase superfamily)
MESPPGHYDATPRTTFHRIPRRGTYDRATVHAILDEALVCFLGFCAPVPGSAPEDAQPFVIPTTFARDGETLYVHGAAASRTLRALGAGARACVTVTLLDGLVYARSAFHHSMNYRSVVVLGPAREVTEPEEKTRALGLFVEKVSPGRSALVRGPNEKELRATSVLAFALDEVSAKVRTGPPIDDEVDLAIPVWAGVQPIGLAPVAPLVPSDPAASAHPTPVLPKAVAP